MSINEKWVCLKVPLTCGEWVQGRLYGDDFLVSCPIDIFTKISLSCQKKETQDISVTASRIDHDGNVTYPPKAINAVKKVCSELGINSFDFKLEIECPKPEGKGFATSSADVLGSIMAVLKLFDLNIPASKFFRMGVEIEPSDSIGFSGLWKINHRINSAKKMANFDPLYLGEMVRGQVMVIDLGGKVETLEFNQNKYLTDLYDKNEATSLKAYNYVKEGIYNRDLSLMAKGSTLSAISHQKILPKEELECIIDNLPTLEALGVVVAHSGTLVGVIYPEEKKDMTDFYSWHRREGPGEIIGNYPLRGGGVEWIGGGVIEAS